MSRDIPVPFDAKSSSWGIHQVGLTSAVSLPWIEMYSAHDRCRARGTAHATWAEDSSCKFEFVLSFRASDSAPSKASNERGEGNPDCACKTLQFSAQRDQDRPHVREFRVSMGIIACCTVYPSDVGVKHHRLGASHCQVRQFSGRICNDSWHICLNSPSKCVFRSTRILHFRFTNSTAHKSLIFGICSVRNPVSQMPVRFQGQQPICSSQTRS